MLICGVDEAGRGPVIGPMVFAAVVVKDVDEGRLADLGVTDSKLLDEKTRDRLFGEITKSSLDFRILSLNAAEITEWMKTASLNDVEAIKTAELLNSLNLTPDVCYVDCPDVKPMRYSQSVKNLCQRETRIVAEHKADLRYSVAGAASILAKVTRDAAVRELSKVHGELGSGYPHDPLTRSWLDAHWNKHKRFPDFVRKRWATVDRKAQLRLTEW